MHAIQEKANYLLESKELIKKAIEKKKVLMFLMIYLLENIWEVVVDTE